VILILGILAVNVIPRFVNLQGNANRAALEGAKVSFSSGMTLLRSTLAIEGKFGQSAVQAGSQIVDINTQGFPGNFPANGCVTLWQDVHDTSDPVNPWLTTPGTMTSNTWEAFTITGTPGGCLFASRRVSPVTEFIVYLPDPGAFGFTENVFIIP